MPAPVAKSMFKVNITCNTGFVRLMALTPSSPIRLPTMMASTTVPKQADKAMRMLDHRNCQYLWLNVALSSLSIIVNYSLTIKP